MPVDFSLKLNVTLSDGLIQDDWIGTQPPNVAEGNWADALVLTLIMFG